jgi:hypothetical protein
MLPVGNDRAHLMKSVNPDKYSINDCPGKRKMPREKKNKVFDCLT